MDQLFQENKDRFFNSLVHNYYILELTKCCNYTEWITVLKSNTISEVYRIIKEILSNQNIRLFVKDQHNNVLHINESDLTIRQLMISNGTFFTPVYSLPNPVIYKIHVDDGHNHLH